MLKLYKIQLQTNGRYTMFQGILVLIDLIESLWNVEECVCLFAQLDVGLRFLDSRSVWSGGGGRAGHSFSTRLGGVRSGEGRRVGRGEGGGMRWTAMTVIRLGIILGRRAVEVWLRGHRQRRIARYGTPESGCDRLRMSPRGVPVAWGWNTLPGDWAINVRRLMGRGEIEIVQIAIRRVFWKNANY